MWLFSFLGKKIDNKKDEYEDYYQDYSIWEEPFIDHNVALKEIRNDCLHMNLPYYKWITLAWAVILGDANNFNPYICDACLSLNGLSYLDEKIARELARFSVYMPIDEHLPVNQRHNHARIELNGINDINVWVAEALASFNWQHISLNWLKKIDAYVAEALCTNNTVAHISLHWIKEIDSDLAEAFCNYNWILYLSWVETATKDSLMILAKHFGKNSVYVGGIWSSVSKRLENEF